VIVLEMWQCGRY